jgi:hypothetical protein
MPRAPPHDRGNVRPLRLCAGRPGPHILLNSFRRGAPGTGDDDEGHRCAGVQNPAEIQLWASIIPPASVRDGAAPTPGRAKQRSNVLGHHGRLFA